jgi:hypothetical protein
MRYSFFVLVISLLSLAISANAQNVFKVTKPSTIGYLEYLPNGYNSNSDKYPIVIFLHGLGERGPASTDYNTLQSGISTVERNGPPKYVKYGTDFPFILISPQLKNNYGDWPIWYITEVIDYCKTYLRIDERRIYLTGLSLGGGGAWVEGTDFSKIFAALAPLCGSRNSPSKASLISNENLPVWAFHGDQDPTVPMSRTVNMVNAINSYSPNPLAKMTIYPGVKHNCWDYAYKPDHTIHNPNVYDWMLSKTNLINAANKVPLANAGADKSVTGSSVDIAGSGSDSDGTIAGYTWQKISGPAATITNPGIATLKATGLTTGTYVFRLQVKDNKGDTDSDYVRVVVQSGTNTNIAPVVSAGADKSVTLPTSSVTIAGSASDSDGSIASYQWSKVSGSTATLAGAASSTLNVSSLVAGSYVFRLTVKDNGGITKSDDMTLVVKSSTTNIAPTASAGPDRILSLPLSNATLFGSASDSDGKIVSYKWTKVSGGSCAFSSTTVLRPTISQFDIGTYVFRITVTDNKGAVKSDDVTMKFDYAPTVSAGSDKTVTLPLSALGVSGTASDKDGTIAKYVWSKYSGPEVTLTNKDTPKVTMSRLLRGTYVLRLSVWDNAGLQSSDFVKIVVQ